MRWLIVFVLVPNLLFYVVGHFYFLDREVLNPDYAVIGAAWPWLPAWLRMASFGVAFLADAITSTGRMYNISPVAGVVAVFRAPVGLLATVILAFALVCALAYGLGALAHSVVGRIAHRTAYTLAGILVIVAMALLVPARSSVAKLTHDIVQRDRGYRTVPQRMSAATDSLRAEMGPPNQNVALVVVESWGVLADTARHNALLSIFHTPDLQRRYEIRSGQIPFRGGTTSGELRELCGVYTDYLVLNDQIIDACLPNQLRRLGFRTVAMHGYKSSYYSRSEWYPRLFDVSLFEDSLATGSERCGTQFRGICDLDAFATFAREVRRERRQLTYWLTIDAHTPVDVDRLPRTDLGECRATPDFCLVVAFWRELFHELAQLAADPTIPATRFVIVGDHAPAFVLQSRARNLKAGFVPFVELKPKL